MAVIVNMNPVMSTFWRGDTMVQVRPFLILHNPAGLVLEGECAGVGDIRALHSGDGKH